ncbi:MAG: hypothetical protein CME36_06440 [unclassified Hahellaceae]|nr:hypothetical protein [Hahellaceae bacterium]
MSGAVFSELDRCFRYGDGLFETILFVDQEPVLFDEHILRLIRGVQRLALDYVVDPANLLKRCRLARNTATELASAQRHVVRVQLSRGEGGRGYTPPDPPSIVREVITCHAIPLIPDVIKVRLLDTRLMISRLLCGIKHCSRLEQVLAASELLTGNKNGSACCWEGLMHDELGFLIEGTRSNIIIETKGRLLTPLLDRSGLRSTLLDSLNASNAGSEAVKSVRMRLDVDGELQVLDQVLNDEWLPADRLPPTAWEACPIDGLALCNSVMGVRPVSELAEIKLPNGRLITNFAAELNARCGYA